MKKHGLRYNLSRYRLLYIMFLPTIVCLLIFNYAPLWGLRMAFYNYIPGKGFDGSTFVGLLNFRTLFNMPDFPRLVRNTVVINLYKTLFSFPMPILFALMLNELRSRRFKRTVQTISYLPHFVSWVIVSAVMYALINGNYGLINSVISSLGFTPPKWYIRPDMWRSILVITDIWKTIGFSSILYLAAITNVAAEMYEAAVIDGATRLKQHLYITIPCILPTIITMFILNMGGIMKGNFDQVFNLVGNNTPLYKTVDVLDFAIYRQGLGKNRVSLATTMGIFQSGISFILVVITNKLANKVGDYGIW